MGANNKYEAAMHGGEYTPTTAVVHSIYMTAWNSTVDPVDQQEVQDKARDEFTRWLETVRAEAKAEALNEAADELDKSKQPARHGLPMMLRADWLRTRANQYKEGE